MKLQMSNSVLFLFYIVDVISSLFVVSIPDRVSFFGLGSRSRLTGKRCSKKSPR